MFPAPVGGWLRLLCGEVNSQPSLALCAEGRWALVNPWLFFFFFSFPEELQVLAIEAKEQRNCKRGIMNLGLSD